MNLPGTEHYLEGITESVDNGMNFCSTAAATFAYQLFFLEPAS